MVNKVSRATKDVQQQKRLWCQERPLSVYLRAIQPWLRRATLWDMLRFILGNSPVPARFGIIDLAVHGICEPCRKAEPKL